MRTLHGHSRGRQTKMPGTQACPCSWRAPNPLVSDREFARYHHLDVGDLADCALFIEWKRTEIALALASDRDFPWLLGRLAALRDETERRRIEFR